MVSVTLETHHTNPERTQPGSIMGESSEKAHLLSLRGSVGGVT